MYYMDSTSVANAAVVGSSVGPVQILLQAPAGPPAQFPGQTSRLAVMPVVADSHAGPPAPHAPQVTSSLSIYR